MKDVKQRSRQFALEPALFLGRLGLTPNALTVIGALLAASVGILIAQGWFIVSGVCLWLFSAADTLDGALARATNRVSVFGAFLDSVCDRCAEAAIFLGLVWWYQSTSNTRGVVLAYLALVGSLMVSYARARAEGVGVQIAEVGWFQRPERIIALGVGLLAAAFAPIVLEFVLALLAILTAVTVVQRVRHVATAARAGTLE
ncbi:MAG: CDP-alcohol phosphatidyltransferase family protein [Chloroflexi bacterium]|nr:CDP-alcohol phosphatidyltransferase family protein [Chloroflexota bacterium]MBV9598444.1 CDP-alcohol phosphatidyltransferase family protein [Chloroflexota bacterium]